MLLSTCIPLFQFHKGTIRTLTPSALVPANWNFNSIKVQLEHKGLWAEQERLSYFNSIKVQLEQRLYLRWQEVTSFQFHKGTIRTFYFIIIILRFFYFNSIKVQLELTAEILRILLYRFQFHKGTIRTMIPTWCFWISTISIP